MKSFSDRARLAGSALLLACAALGCRSSAAIATPPPHAGVQARVLLFSGRPDPTFAIDDAASLLALRDALAQARANPEFRESTVTPSRLGYKGFLVTNPSGGADLPRTIAVFRGDIEIDGDSRRFLTDGGALERWLIERATESKAIGERELEWIRER